MPFLYQRKIAVTLRADLVIGTYLQEEGHRDRKN